MPGDRHTLFSDRGGPQPEASCDTDKGLSRHLIGQLADWYLVIFEKERRAAGTVQQEALNAELRAVLADHGVLPQFIDIEFERVKMVYAPLGQSAGR